MQESIEIFVAISMTLVEFGINQNKLCYVSGTKSHLTTKLSKQLNKTQGPGGVSFNGHKNRKDF